MIKKEHIGNYLISYPNSGIEKVGAIEEVAENSGSCFIFKVKIFIDKKPRNIVLKMADDYLKIDPSFKLSPKRLAWEYEALKYFSKISSPRYFPEVLWYDSANYVLVMEDIKGKDGLLLKNEIDEGRLHPEIIKDLADFFADLHLASYKQPHIINIQSDKNFSDHWLAFLRTEVVDKFYTVGARKVSLASIVEDLLNKSRQAPQAVIWMDPLPKNIFVHGNSFKLIDFETVAVWDIAWDPAIFISEWIIKSASKDRKVSDEAQGVVRMFFSRYLSKIENKIDEKEL
ncbi:MAG: phosphotransferase, partial [Candidatus Gracilibacteria bacterium]